MYVRLLMLVLCAGGCATSQPGRRASPGATQPSLEHAERQIADGRYDDALTELDGVDARAERMATRVAYMKASAYLYKRDTSAAERVFRQHIELLRRNRSESSTEGWVHNALTWVRWAADDSKGAVGENEEVARFVARAGIKAEAKRDLLLHYWWDRAYLLLESGAIEEAARARAEYEAIARLPDEHDGLAVLKAYFDVKAGRAAAAREAAGTVDVAKDDDIQDLYVIALALEAGGDEAGGELAATDTWERRGLPDETDHSLAFGARREVMSRRDIKPAWAG